MIKSFLKRIGGQAAHAAVQGAIPGSRLNMKLGYALFRDRRIGIWPKLFALAIGGAITALLVALEISPESILALIIPGLELTLDFAADGLEALLLPFLFAALTLPFMAPRPLVDQIMAERAGATMPALPPAPTAP